MKKTEVIICDKCNQKISDKKCDICNIDLCKDCTKPLQSNFGDWRTPIVDLKLCKDCRRKSMKLIENECLEIKNNKIKKDNIVEMTNKFVISQIKNRGILNELEEEDDKEKN